MQNELRKCSAFLAPEEVSYIAKTGLEEDRYGFSAACLLGPLLRGQPSDEAKRVANNLDQIKTQCTRLASQEEANKEARSEVLISILSEIGTASIDVYQPFLNCLGSDNYEVSNSLAAKLRMSLEDMPKFARDEICLTLLKKEQKNDENPGYHNTFQMFLSIPHLSQAAQDAVFAKAKQTWEDFPSGNNKEDMARHFSIGNRIESMHPDARNKWRDLFSS